MAAKAPLWGSCRLVLACCAFVSLLNCFVQRFNLSFAVVCMLRPAANNTDTDQTGDLAWDRPLTELLLSAFFYGYLLAQLAGGRVSDALGGRRPFVLGNAAQSLLAALLPAAAAWGAAAVFAVRLLQGVACGFFLPAMFSLFRVWMLPEERTSLLAFAYVGVPLSFILTYPLSGILCHFMSWPFIFYVTGLFGVVCSLLTYFLVFDSPESHPRISQEELAALREAVPPQLTKQKKVPLRAMLLSGPVNANHVANFCYNWGFNTVATNLPIFLNEVLEFDVRQNGLFSALPYAGLMVMRLIVATSFARCVRATGLGLTVVRKLNHTIGAVGAGACMLGLVALPSAYKVTAVLLVAASQTAAELSYTAGFLGSLLDLAPAHAGLLSGWTNAVGAATGLLAPGVVGALTRQGLRDEWNTVLYITAGFYLLGALVYLVFGSSELQPWAAPGAANSEPEAEPLLTADTTKAVPPQSSQSS
ncbi:sialin-like [Bacillus rossius redtenbacheri]|uniref:sialin-like n=1 Tax=Bacillus rossius redtenbacheri TaxID=93214 RepID=UPI002FDD643A